MAYRPFNVSIPSAYSDKQYRLTGNVPIDQSTIRMDGTPWAPEMRYNRDAGMDMPWLNSDTTGSGEGFFATPERMREGLDVNQYSPGPWWGKGYGAGVVPDFLKGIVPNDDWDKFNDHDAPWFKELKGNYDQLRNQYATGEYLGDQSFGGLLKGFAKDLGPIMSFAGLTGGLGSLLNAAGGAGAGTGITGSLEAWLAETAAADMAAGSLINSNLANAGLSAAGTAAANGGIDFLAANDAITGGLSGLGTGGGATATNIGGASTGLTEGATLASEANFVPGGFELGTGSAATAAGGLATAGATGASTPLTSGAKQWLADKLGVSVGAVDMLGTAAMTLFGMYQANEQSGAAGDLATQLAGYGAPSRARYEASFAPGFSMANEPGYQDAINQGSDTLLRRLSATGGNPFGNPGGVIEAQKQVNAGLTLPALQNYRNQNAATGGYGAFNSAAPQAMANASGQDNSWMTVLGRGLSDIWNPVDKTGDAETKRLLLGALAKLV